MVGAMEQKEEVEAVEAMEQKEKKASRAVLATVTESRRRLDCCSRRLDVELL